MRSCIQNTKLMSSEAKQNTRAHSLDALRGYAILTMVLSATVAGGILPGGCTMRRHRRPHMPSCLKWQD